MYSESYGIYKSVWKWVLLAVFGELALQFLDGFWNLGGGKILGSVIIWSGLAYQSHIATIAPGNQVLEKDMRRWMGFTLRTVALSVMAMALPIMISIISVFAGGFGFLVGFAIAALVAMVTWILVFSLLGTWLPAYIFEKEQGLSLAYERGAANFMGTVKLFVSGPLFVYVATAVLAVAILLSIGGQILAVGSFKPVVIVVSFALYFVQAYAVVMLAWLLSYSYLKTVRLDGPSTT